MLGLYDFTYPPAAEIYKLLRKYETSPNNKTAKAQVRELLFLVNNMDLELSAHEADTLLKFFQARLKTFSRTVGQDVDGMIKLSQATVDSRKKVFPAPKSIDRMPEAAAMLKLFNQVAQARTPDKKIILLRKNFEYGDKANFDFEIVANFQNYKKLFHALLDGLGYEIEPKNNNRKRS